MLKKDLEQELNRTKLILDYARQDIDKKDKEIERLHSIIEEAREYVEKNKAKLPVGRNDFTCELVYSDEVVLANKLLQILDKAGGEK